MSTHFWTFFKLFVKFRCFKYRAQHTNPFFWTLFRHDIVKMLAHTPVYSALFPRPDEKSNQKNGKPKAIIKREVFKAEGCRHTDVWQARQHRKIPFLVGFGGFGYCVLCLRRRVPYPQSAGVQSPADCGTAMQCPCPRWMTGQALIEHMQFGGIVGKH